MSNKAYIGIINALVYLWQLPQHLIGLLLILVLRAKKVAFLHIWEGHWFWEFERKGQLTRSISGCSLGKYIILPARENFKEALLHEYGHSIQSRYLGPLYLLVVGIPSAIFNNLWDRLFHKKWPFEKRLQWYYSRWPEKQADELGGVQREFSTINIMQ